MLHTDWSSPLAWSAPVWGVVTLVGYLVYLQYAMKWDKGQWDNDQWK